MENTETQTSKNVEENTLGIHEDRMAPAELLNNCLFRKDGNGDCLLQCGESSNMKQGKRRLQKVAGEGDCIKSISVAKQP